MAQKEKKTLDVEQQRAAFAWARIKSHGRDDKYKNLAKAAPALVMTNGLMQTLAFYESKDEPHKRLSRDICQWLAERGFSNRDDNEFQGVMERLHSAESGRDYRRATEEALALLRWIRQFASALG